MFLGTEVFEIQTKDRKTHCRASLQAGCGARHSRSDIRLPDGSDGIPVFVCPTDPFAYSFLLCFIFLL